MKTRSLVVAALAASALALPVAAPASATSAKPSVDVTVKLTSSTFTASTTHIHHSGAITFKVSASGLQPGSTTQFVVVRPTHGWTINKVVSTVRSLQSEQTAPAQAAAGIRAVQKHAIMYGGADPRNNSALQAVLFLKPGVYYAVGSDNFVVKKIVVSGRARTRYPRPSATVSFVNPDRFASPARLPRQGYVRVVNRSDTLHFLSFNRVKPGTTDRDISNYFNNPQSGPPSFVLPTAFGTDVLSPGQRQLLWYSAPKGTYAELCFVPDDKTGMPHAFMGMHKVVKLS